MSAKGEPRNMSQLYNKKRRKNSNPDLNSDDNSQVSIAGSKQNINLNMMKVISSKPRIKEKDT